MADEFGNDKAAHLPSAGDLKNFLDDADQGDAIDTMAQTERATEPETFEDTTEEPLKGDTFDRKYVEKLRRENASYRERARKFESMFEGYEEGAVNEWGQMISTFKQDPKSVAEQWKDLSEQVLSQFTPEEQEAIAEATDDQPLTLAQVQNLLAQKEQEWAQEAMVDDIEHEAQQLGYNLKSREYKILLQTAMEIPSGDLKEAHNILMSERQRWVDEAIAELEKQGGGPKKPSSLVGVPDSSVQIKDFKDAKAALSNFLDANLK